MENPKTTAALLSSCLLCLCFAAPSAFADRDDDDRRIRAKLDGFQEQPLALSTAATGRFRGKIDRRSQVIEYELSYSGLNSGVQQAHIHFGQRSQAAGIAAFLCTNLAPRPGVPACPSPSGTVSGTIRPADVVGPAAQGIGPGEFAELLEAIDEGVAYVNVHSVQFPGGEIRGQIR